MNFTHTALKMYAAAAATARSISFFFVFIRSDFLSSILPLSTEILAVFDSTDLGRCLRLDEPEVLRLDGHEKLAPEGVMF